MPGNRNRKPMICQNYNHHYAKIIMLFFMNYPQTKYIIINISYISGEYVL